ncbi:MAG TPA: hypothetical protein VEK11_14620 [Thermoanaerobaculia bacterium]|nr:hypothetical protein [Thermoanaerobaculia bacterium]
MLLETILATRLLGLVAGQHEVTVQAGPEVRAMELRVDGETAARITAASSPNQWKAKIDFGRELAPHELTAVAFDAEGNEIARDTQAVNLARPPAEIGVMVVRDADGTMSARIRSKHLGGEKPQAVTVKLDGKPITNGTAMHVPLGNPAPDTVHVLEVEVAFADGIAAKKEVVFGGGFSEQMPAELTPMITRVEKPCFRLGNSTVKPAAVEKGSATVFFVLNGGAGESRAALTPRDRHDTLFSFPDADFRLVLPNPHAVRTAGSEAEIFPSEARHGQRGTRWVLLESGTPFEGARIADAAAVAGFRALRGGRRAVIVMFGDTPAADRSLHDPEVVRRYLERIGVPLFVWWLAGPKPDARWGEIIDVSTASKLLIASDRLRRELDSQRVAWLPLAPMNAYRTKTCD